MKYDYTEYIGIPWKSVGRDINKGLDCWGVVWHVYKTRYGIELPILSHINIDDGRDKTTEDVNKIFESIHKDFRDVDLKRGCLPQEGDILLMRIVGQPVHAGVALSHKKMLHSGRKFNCVVDNFTSKEWQHRIEGVYRHKDFI